MGVIALVVGIGLTLGACTPGKASGAVVQKWTARWALGADNGTLDGLETDGALDDFEVRELQAVRNS